MGMLKGSCCCGTVAFELDEAPTMMATCHCTRCRKLGMSTFVFANRAAFRIVSGEDRIAVYQPDPGHKYHRCFCAACGTSLGEMLGADDSFPVPANCFDTPLDLAVRFHEFVDEKPTWSLICDDAKQFPRHPVQS